MIHHKHKTKEYPKVLDAVNMNAGAGKKVDGVIKMQLQKTDLNAPGIESSINGKILKCNHELHVYVKHDAWNERGKGIKVFSLPILIKRKPNR